MSPHRLLRKRTLKVLLVADDPQEVLLVRRSLRTGTGRAVRVADLPTVDDALCHLETRDVDLVMLDLALGPAAGLDAVRAVRRTAPTVPIIAIADETNERQAILALQRDAQNYVLRHQLNPSHIDTRGRLRARAGPVAGAVPPHDGHQSRRRRGRRRGGANPLRQLNGGQGTS